jgi:hypothetical protein
MNLADLGVGVKHQTRDESGLAGAAEPALGGEPNTRPGRLPLAAGQLGVRLEAGGPDSRAGDRYSPIEYRLKNSHISRVALMSWVVGPVSHSGSGSPPGHECPPPSMV